MPAQKYRKKPVVIDAWEFRGWSNATEIQQWAPGTVFVPEGYEHHMRHKHEHDGSTGRTLDWAPAYLVIKTLEGDHRADIGDYIIRGVAGEFYPCKPGVFAETYEAAD